MIDYLEQLVEERKFREALALAERLLSEAKDSKDALRIHAARVVAHCRLSDFQAALAGGDFAMKLAEDLDDWDAYGVVALFVGVAYSKLGQLSEAITRISAYLANLHRYTKALAHEYNAWYNLGILQLELNRPVEATRALSNALTCALRNPDPKYAHGVRQSLIDAYLRAGSYEPIPRLLAQCGRYLRNNPDVPMHKMSRANHMQLRSEYALATGRVERARSLAAHALADVAGEPAHEYLFHMVLAKAAARQGMPAEALGHGLAARSCAILSRRPDLEREAGDFLHELTQTYPSAIETVDKHYISGSF